MTGKRIDGINWPRLFAEYTPPAPHVAALVQRPAYQIDASALAVAYMRDYREIQASRRLPTIAAPRAQ